ncbi:unnamed protein product [Enterobius vermicularis]|uniref:Bestrophin homolog n=1 Tax=Enterobius vermicularis TaxID=51028 RepID=A0A158Q9P1_ENTVE|nr:unnamed protein product [Enterobius vermicularis]
MKSNSTLLKPSKDEKALIKFLKPQIKIKILAAAHRNSANGTNHNKPKMSKELYAINDLESSNMTVSYIYDIATATFWQQWRVLFYWKGSLWKAVYLEISAWIIIYALLSIIYRCCLSDPQKETFELVVEMLDKLNDRIPLTFMLGFYVTNVASRWWTIIMNIGFTDNLIMLAGSYISEADERARAVKTAILRYICLVQVLVYRKCSVTVAKRYRDIKSLVAAGYLEASEVGHINDEVFWIPLNWAMSLVAEARNRGLIASDHAVQQIYDVLLEFYNSQQTLLVYNWIPVPLGYTQVAFLTVRCYFLVAVIGRQYVWNTRESSRILSQKVSSASAAGLLAKQIENRSSQIIALSEATIEKIDLYVPFETIFQMVLYIGWLTVAEAMLCPLGDDDDDFDGEWWINRNFAKALEILSESYQKAPPLCSSENEKSEGKSTMIESAKPSEAESSHSSTG